MIFFSTDLLELITVVPLRFTASHITWAVGSSYQGTLLIVLKSGLKITSMSVGLYTSSGSSLSSVA